MDKTKIDINDLPNYSSWPSILLGLTPWDVPKRNLEKIDKEYDKDKYAKCLAFYVETNKKVTPEEVKDFEFKTVADPICTSIGNEFYLMPLESARSAFYELLINTIGNDIEEETTVVELGCGYGYNLYLLQKHFKKTMFIGGEYSPNAVLLASKLFSEYPLIDVLEFNFYDVPYKILQDITSPIIVFTSHAIEQLPESSIFLDRLYPYREKIKAVFHFEPAYDLYDMSLIGLMRRRYSQANDYNRDLLRNLRARSYIRICNIQANVLGLNPFNPTSIIKWVYIS